MRGGSERIPFSARPSLSEATLAANGVARRRRSWRRGAWMT
jgi:hypothetical protein